MISWSSHREKVLAFLGRPRAASSAEKKAHRASTAWPGRADLLKRITPSVIIITVQVVLAAVSLRAVSLVRAYVGGESLWSKEQKNAVYLLHRYTEQQTSEDFEKFRSALSVPLGDMEARRALEKSPPDYEAAVRGFTIAGLHPDDIPGMIRLFVYFRRFPFMAEAVDIWRESDSHLMELSALGESIHRQFANRGSPDELAAAQARINQLDQRLSPLAFRFSRALGVGSRTIATRLTLVNVGAAVALTLLILLHTRNLLRQRCRFENGCATRRSRRKSRFNRSATQWPGSTPRDGSLISIPRQNASSA